MDVLRKRSDDSGADFLLGGGEMGKRMRKKDWSQTVFGAVETWPHSLKTSLSIMLASRFAMVVAWGPEFRFFYNDRYRPVLGASKHPAALGTPAEEIFPEAWPFIGPLFESTRRGDSVALDDVLIPLDRYGYLENCYFTLSYSPIRDESGGVGGMLAVVAETTERVEGERRLKTLRELARRAVDAKSPEQACENAAAIIADNAIDVPWALFYLLDPTSDAARLAACAGTTPDSSACPAVIPLSSAANPAWPLHLVMERRWNHVLSDLHDRFGYMPGGPYPEPAHTAIIAPLARPGQTRPDGVVVFGVSPRRALDDSYRGFYDLAADHILTAVRNALSHQEEQRRVEALAELDRAKTAFFSNVSHEFRTPLTLLLGPLEDVLRTSQSSLSVQTREQLEVAHRNSLRLLKLVNTLLDFSRIEAGRFEVVYEPVDLATYTSELASVFRSTMEKAGLQFVVDCAPLDGPVYVDRGMWEKTVFNLLSNAFKFTFEGTIRACVRGTRDAAQFVVEDTGTGIPADEIPKVFARFHRVKGARGRTYEGTGIGLALVQELVRLHVGTVSVTSQVGKGSTFVVSIPRGTSHLPEDRVRDAQAAWSPAVAGQAYIEEAMRWLPGQVQSASDALPETERTATILVADDNNDMRDYVARLLSPRFHIIAASDGNAALDAAKRNKPDLILTDIMMPGLDGVGLLQAVRSIPELRLIPVIALSAKAGEEARVEGLIAGADDYIVKPFSARELLARIDTHLQMVKLRRESDVTIRRLAMQYEVTRIVGNSSQLDEAITQIVQVIGESLGWDAGGAWRLDSEGQELSLVTVWHRNSAPIPEFEAASRRLSAQPEVGLPGRVWATLRPAWIEDISADDNFPRRAAAAADGLATGLAFPILFGDSLLGVIELFSLKIRRVDEELLRTLGAVGTQVGQLIGRKRMEVERDDLLETAQKAKREAELANRLKDEFLATVSHELRTPLNAMLGWTRLLRSGKLDESRHVQALETVERNAVAQQQIIEDILDVSRIITGKLRLDVTPLELAAVVEAAIDSVRPTADAKGVLLESFIDSDPNLVLGDSNRLQQVVWNLLSNAIKFTPRGGRVHIALEPVKGHVEITVRDNGKGVSQEFLPFVFDRFRQADSSTTRQFGGLGIGLAIVRHLTELHGGTVHVSSPGEGQGATFVVRLPLAALDGAADRLGEPERRLPPVADLSFLQYGLSLEGIRVLGVDDEPDARALLSLVLTQCRAEVKTAASAREALAILKDWKPDVLISDIGMPDADGYSLIRKIRSLPAESGGNLPAAALTAYARSEDRVQALAAGFQSYVTKPVEPSELVAVVASLSGRVGRTAV